MATKRLVRCVLADDATRLPMPDRGGRYFAAGPHGETVDLGSPYYAAAFSAGDILKADDRKASPSKSKTTPSKED